MNWTPLENDFLTRDYPQTPVLPHLNGGMNQRFFDQWKEEAPLPSPDCTFVLVRGIFGRYMPDHFGSLKRELRRQGQRVVIAPTGTQATIEENIGRLRDFVNTIPGQLFFMSHSKGGLETLLMLGRSSEIAARTGGAVLCQVPTASSAVLDGFLTDRFQQQGVQRFKNAGMKVLLTLIGARAGATDITHRRIDGFVQEIQSCDFPCRILHTATWSNHPTSWLDSYHQLLGHLRPGVAHDGQFYTDQMIWPKFDNILVGSVDHAQPVVGGHGMPYAKFWLHLLRLHRET